MLPPALTGSASFGALTAIAALLLAAARPGARWGRAAWAALAAVALAHAIAIVAPRPGELDTNLVHYWLGAKYPVPYARFYEAFQAARGLPAIGIRDLDHPDRLLRAAPAERRAYWIGVLRARGIAFDAATSEDTLARLARDTGALADTSARVLRAVLPASRIDAYRADVRTAAAAVRGRPATDDFGYNGSPFVALVRRADPTLYAPLGPVAAWWNLAFQLVALVAAAWLAGAALGVGVDGRLAACALLLASYDCVAFALSGLVFGELWLAIAAAAWAMRRRHAPLAGAAIACAGLLKLFPFALLLVPVATLVRARPAAHDRARAWRTLAWCAAATVGLGALAALAGRSWGEFLAKVVVQFGHAAMSINTVSTAAALQALGIHHSPAGMAVSALAVAALVAMALADDAGDAAAPARRALVVVAATGWLARGWLDYYALAPLLLLPAVARTHRTGAALAAGALAVAMLLPDFGDPRLLTSPALRFAKLLPYLVVPAWLVALELRSFARVPAFRRAALAAVAVVVAVNGVETWRVRTADALAADGHARLAAGDPAGALPPLGVALSLAPGDPAARLDRAVALAMLARPEAGAAFDAALARQPDSAPAHDDYGRWLAAAARPADAARELERALALDPASPTTLAMLARVRLQQGDRGTAVQLLTQAHELDPANESYAQALTLLARP